MAHRLELGGENDFLWQLKDYGGDAFKASHLKASLVKTSRTLISSACYLEHMEKITITQLPYTGNDIPLPLECTSVQGALVHVCA